MMRGMTQAPSKKQRLALHWQILIGLFAGLIVGVLINSVWSEQSWSDLGVVNPTKWLAGQADPQNEAAGFTAMLVRSIINLNSFIGDLFVRCLRTISVPIVLFSLIVGASSLNDIKKLSRIGAKTVGIYVFTTAIAITVGLVFANLVAPGAMVDQALRDQMAQAGAVSAQSKIEAAQAPDAWSTLLNIVPLNPFASLVEGNMLQVVFFSLTVGIALSLVKQEKAQIVTTFCDAMTDVIIKLVDLIMFFAPYAVFALLVRVVAQMGLEVLSALLAYCATVMAGLALMIFGVYPLILKALSGVSFRRFFHAIAPAQLLAFSSSSSSATLPVTIRCAEKRLGIHEEVSSFALPLGATINMDGTALYQGVAAMFIAQLYGIDLDLSAQLTIVLTATLASIGTAGVPGVGLIMLVIVLQSVGMGAEVMAGGIAIIFGVDRILDMCRTSCNVTGDLMVSAVVAKSEGALMSDAEAEAMMKKVEEQPLDEFPRK